MTMNSCWQGAVSACLLTSHFWSEALSVVSFTAQLVATVSGALIGVITLYRMWRNSKAVALPPEHLTGHPE
jgi:TRAP-type C4-dicarboxylate transport system permease small subunit